VVCTGLARATKLGRKNGDVIFSTANGRQYTLIFLILTIQSREFLLDKKQIKPVSIRNDSHSRFFASIRGSKIPSLVALLAWRALFT
jgi:hypothetical protein